MCGKTCKEVADKLKAMHHDQAAGLNIAPEQQTVAHYLDRWLDTSITPHRCPKTAASYAQQV